MERLPDTGILTPKQTTQSYGYDNLNRLTSYGDGSNAYNYQYDANGNRTAMSINGATMSFDISPTSNRMTAFNPEGKPVDVPADAAGNLTRAPNYSSPVFQYGPTGRIESVTGGYPQKTVTYTYNSLGERLNTANSHYMFDQFGRQIGEYALDGTPMEETVYLGSQPVAVLKSMPQQATNVYYVFADHLNTPRLITRASDDKVVWRWDIAEPFGASLPAENPSGLGQFVYNRRFPGQVFDAFLGVYYNYFRDYDPGTGRYVQSDPTGLTGGINTYSYVEDNPIMGVDALGLLTVHIWDYKGSADAWGHTSITLEDGTHISWWPGPQRVGTIPGTPIFVAKAIPNQELADDIRLEQRLPSRNIRITGLDETAIKNWWNSFKVKNKWQTLNQNCSTTAAEGLIAGGGANYSTGGQTWHVVWSPNDVTNFANSINDGINIRIILGIMK